MLLLIYTWNISMGQYIQEAGQKFLRAQGLFKEIIIVLRQ